MQRDLLTFMRRETLSISLTLSSSKSHHLHQTPHELNSSCYGLIGDSNTILRQTC
ncbi:hypothetical protein L218DRAFT_959854 [Marasmius fiardii PR-910]|nr:hypothetical protein L218DRAFT_959854 [Marasmius fiardii PR-910]